MKQLHDIHFEFQTKSQLYKFTDTSLFINYKEYPYKDLTVTAFHEGNAFMNAWYSLETSDGKKLIVGYKPKRKDVATQLTPIMKYISNFNEKESAAYHQNHKEFEFLVDNSGDDGDACKERIYNTVTEYIKSDKQFMLSDNVFDGEIQLDDTDPDNLRVEMFMYNLNDEPVHIGYVPERLMFEMKPYLEEGITYELRILITGYGMGKKKYMVRALLIFDRRK